MKKNPLNSTQKVVLFLLNRLLSSLLDYMMKGLEMDSNRAIRVEQNANIKLQLFTNKNFMAAGVKILQKIFQATLLVSFYLNANFLKDQGMMQEKYHIKFGSK